ncbi:hypothetical protein EDD86DRAFT_19152 [Gorgonomyces haynaldii]|nr:hypothetical protein EDD86DRAFT_19152 [Gorgonomyces haynaldii]
MKKKSVKQSLDTPKSMSSKCIQVNESALQDVTERYQQELKEASQTHQREKQLMDQLNAKTTTLEEFEIKYYEMQRIFKEKTAETEEVQKTLHALESRVQQQQVKEITYMEQVNALEQQLGEALFERDASLDREKHLKLTIQSLQEQLQQVTKKTSEKTASALELYSC